MIREMRYGFIVLLAVILVSCLAVADNSLEDYSSIANVRVTMINQDPDPASQGGISELKFRIENLGAQTLNDVQVEILPQYPFSLYSGNAMQNIGKLRTSETGADASVISYKLKVDENAIKGDNELELRVRDGLGLWKYYTDNNFIIRVSTLNVSDIKVYLKDSTIQKANTKGDVTFALANADTGLASFVQLTLLPSEDYEILSSSSYFYIGEMSADDTESQDISIFVKDTEKDKIILPVMLEYKDPDNIKYKKYADVELRLYNPKEMKKFGFTETKSMAYILVMLLVILVILFYWYRRKKRK
ncbi:MAG: hypothetical protein Q8L29_03120 [archaeon]|nr:hypothetical protein [archaeon]